MTKEILSHDVSTLGSLLNVQVFKTSGSYTPTFGMSNCIIQAVGGGGAGGGANGSNVFGGGGGSGGFSQSYVSAVAIGASQTVTIGAGGTGVSAANGNNGSATSVGSIITANGGSGGFSSTNGATGGPGGTAGTGDITTTGGGGGFGTSVGGKFSTGIGGSAFFGGGGAIVASASSTTNGNIGTANTGGGGSGSYSSSGSSTGGAGGSGIVIIYEFDSSNSVVLPTTTNHIATYSDTSGTLSEDPTTAITNGALSAGTTVTAGTGITATSGNIVANSGFIQALESSVSAGSNGFSGALISFPSTLNNGSLTIQAGNAGANFPMTITTGTLGQTSIITIPDPGTLSSNFILSESGGTQTISSGNVSITNGSLSVPGGTVQGGIVQAGSNGVTGEFISYAPTLNNGFLVIQAVDAGGPFVTTINTGTMGQSTAYTIPDIGGFNGSFVVSTSDLRMKSVSAASAAGGSASQSFTDTFCTSSSVVTGSWTSQTNAASVLTIVPSNGSFVVNSTADAGVGTFSYTISK